LPERKDDKRARRPESSRRFDTLVTASRAPFEEVNRPVVDCRTYALIPSTPRPPEFGARVPTADDVARLVLYLASDDSTYSTGPNSSSTAA
jgi:NAD(P)-dependent dehydrogenase (short-subunit alcohol dehydrogenase family)